MGEYSCIHGSKMLILIVLGMKYRRNTGFEMDTALSRILHVSTFEEIFIH